VTSVIDYPINLLDKFFRLRGTTWHLEIQSIFSKLRLPFAVYFIDILLFKNKVRDIWETEVSRFLLSTKGKIFVDVGSCYGRFAVLLADNYEKVIAIDPDPGNVITMSAIFTYAHLKNVVPLQLAVSDMNGHAGLHLDTHSDWVRLSKDCEKPDIIVETITLTRLLKATGADLAKVDVEGWEWQVLNGSVEILDRIKSWAVELHDPKRKTELEHWFISRGYSVRWLDERHIFALKKE
jgi:FkbM family methyltransferase